MNSFEEMLGTIETDLEEIQAELGEYQNENFPERPPEFFCLELNGEAGELANAEKKRWKGRYVEEDIYAEEAADTFIALLNYANSRGIALGKAVKRKLRKIENERLELKKQGKDY